MKEIKLNPEQIIGPGEYKVGKIDVLKKYFREYNKGRETPPVLVVHFGEKEIEDITTIFEKSVKEWEDPAGEERRLRMFEHYRMYHETEKLRREEAIAARKDDFQTLISILRNTPYTLQDGNHRAIAATLTNQQISALELDTDADLSKVDELTRKRKLKVFNREGKTIDALRIDWISYVLGGLSIHTGTFNLLIRDRGYDPKLLRYAKSIKERVEELTNNRDVPQYMISRYRTQ